MLVELIIIALGIIKRIITPENVVNNIKLLISLYDINFGLLVLW